MPVKARELHNHHFDSTIWNDPVVGAEDSRTQPTDTRDEMTLAVAPGRAVKDGPHGLFLLPVAAVRVWATAQ